jgi:hypothetical protein
MHVEHNKLQPPETTLLHFLFPSTNLMETLERSAIPTVHKPSNV